MPSKDHNKTHNATSTPFEKHVIEALLRDHNLANRLKIFGKQGEARLKIGVLTVVSQQSSSKLGFIFLKLQSCILFVQDR